MSKPLRLIGVLDWEMSTVGDPLMDLGIHSYWVQLDDPESLETLGLCLLISKERPLSRDNREI